MPTRYPPPEPEVLAHEFGHLVHSMRPHYERTKFKGHKKEDRKITNWSTVLYVKNAAMGIQSLGWAPTQVASLEDAIATAVRLNLEGGYSIELGRRERAKPKTKKERAAEKQAYADKMFKNFGMVFDAKRNRFCVPELMDT